MVNRNRKRLSVLLAGLFLVLLITAESGAADVMVIGDENLRPVAEVINGLKKTIGHAMVVKSPRDVRDDLESLAGKEDVKVVVALGTDALALSLSLPEAIPVIYGFVIKPFETERRNITGVYMETPVSQYFSILNAYFPHIRKVGIIHQSDTSEYFVTSRREKGIKTYIADDPYEFIRGIKALSSSVDAVIILPERNLISSASLKEAYLYSFSEKLPLIGISEKHVKSGSLFSLVFDLGDMGRQLADIVEQVISRGSAAGISQSPPEKFKLYFNRHTAESMGVSVHPGLLETAERVYP